VFLSVTDDRKGCPCNLNFVAVDAHIDPPLLHLQRADVGISPYSPFPYRYFGLYTA